MNIIIGEENAKQFEGKYTVLELDTIVVKPSEQIVKAYCIVENIPLTNLARVAEMQDLHKNLLINYRKKDWNYCEQALEYLVNFWGDEMNTYYDSLKERIAKYKEQDPGEDWNGSIEKTVAGI